jgi:hypothetical protein
MIFILPKRGDAGNGRGAILEAFSVRDLKGGALSIL